MFVMKYWHSLCNHLIWQSFSVECFMQTSVVLCIMSSCNVNFYPGSLLQLHKHDFRVLCYDTNFTGLHMCITLVCSSVNWLIYLSPVLLPGCCTFGYPCIILHLYNIVALFLFKPSNLTITLWWYYVNVLCVCLSYGCSIYGTQNVLLLGQLVL